MVKRVFMFAIMSVFTLGAFAANKEDGRKQQVNVGDELVVNTPASDHYKFINFPNKNFIIKKGSLASLKSMEGKTVVVEQVNTRADGTTEVVLKRKDGLKFFNMINTVKANLEPALQARELTL